MIGFRLGITPPDLWRLTFWEFDALIAARIDDTAETIRPLDSLFDQVEALTHVG